MKERWSQNLFLFALASACWLGAASPCCAQRLALPLDLHQGLYFGADRPQTPYVFAANLAPGLDFDVAQVNLVAGAVYTNPEWDAALGASASLLQSALLSDIGLRVSAQGSYLVRAEAVRVSIGIGVEALGLLRIAVWPAYDFEAKKVLLTAALGVDVVSVVKALQGPQETEFEPIP